MSFAEKNFLPMTEQRKQKIQDAIAGGLDDLFGLWDELGIDEESKDARNQTVHDHFISLLNKMLFEEKAAKKKILDSLEHHTKQALKLAKEMGLGFDEPDSCLPLVKYEQAVRHEAKRLRDIKEERLVEVRQLVRQDEELCHRLAAHPYYISSTTVPNTAQLEALKDHIRNMEDEKFVRLEQYIRIKEAILRLYTDLDTEPQSEFEREVACEETERFILSTDNMERVSRILTDLEDMVKRNQRLVMEAVERIDSLYERLQMDMNEKFQFLGENEGHSSTVIRRLEAEMARLEEIKKANVEKFVINLRDELHKLWDDCYYSEKQRNAFTPLHSTDFSEELLELHEAECLRLKETFSLHKDLFRKVAERQEVWNKFMELERRSKDPTRLMTTKGNSLLLEEKERNRVNKVLPKLEKDLHALIEDWEAETGKIFLVNGVNFMDFINQQKEEHRAKLEAEKEAREQAKKKTLLHETQFGTHPVTPAKLKHSTLSVKTPGRTVRANTPGSSRLMSRIQTGLSTLRSPLAGRVGKGVSPRVGGKSSAKTERGSSKASLSRKKRSSYGINKSHNKSVKAVAANKDKLKRGVLSELDNSIVRTTRSATDLTLEPVDYAKFEKGNYLNSTRAGGAKLTRTPSYMTPTQAAQNRMFKTPSTPLSRSRHGTPKSASTSKLSTLRSGRTLPFLI